MIAMLVMVGLAAAADVAEPEGSTIRRPDALPEALATELARAMDEMRLPDQPSPYLVSYEIIDGEVATARASFGALLGYETQPYRNLRVDVRVGDYSLDNGNFDASFGERDGTVTRGLPNDDVPLALRREIWLATDEAYKGATEALSAKLAAREGSGREYGPDLLPVDPLTTAPRPTPTLNGERVRDTTLALSAALADHGALEEAAAVGRTWVGTRIIVSSEGTRAWLPTGYAVVRVQASTRTADGARLRDARWWVAQGDDGLPPVEQMVAEVSEMVDWLEALGSAPVEDDYLGPVLFEEAAAVEFYRQLLAPELSGTPPAERGRDAFGEIADSPPTARLGRRLMPEGWTVVDDPTADLEAAGGYTHDFEGVAARRVELVNDGVVRDLLMSRVPREDLEGSTGHGRSLGADRRVALPAMVTVTPSRSRSHKKLRRKALALGRAAGLPYVIVVRRLTPPAMAEDFRIAFSGDAPLPGLTAPLEAYRLYSDGREEPVRGLEFVGVDRRAMRDVVVAGKVSDPVGVMDTESGPSRYSIGMVGGLPATWSAPSVVVAELELRGGGGREPRVVPPPPLSPEW